MKAPANTLAGAEELMAMSASTKCCGVAHNALRFLADLRFYTAGQGVLDTLIAPCPAFSVQKPKPEPNAKFSGLSDSKATLERWVKQFFSFKTIKYENQWSDAFDFAVDGAVR